jgi:hypothetical protein
MEETKRVELTVEKNGKIFGLTMPEKTNLGEAYEGAFALLSRILEIAQESAEKMRPQEKE